MEFEDCDKCGNQGWTNDDLSHAMGGRYWRYCDCEYGNRLGQKDDEVHREKQRQSPYKTCPNCGGAGKIRKEN